MTATTSPAIPQMMNWSCQAPRWDSVWLDTSASTRLPTTGPRVQKPMADARPSCGEKSLTRAGVATRMTPSTTATTAYSTPKTSLSGAFGMPNRTSRAVTTRP